MDETSIIEKYLAPLAKKYDESLALEDDAAVLNTNKKKKIVSVDNFIHGVHCPIGLRPDWSVKRAIFVAVSDLAAMAAKPYCMFLSISLPNKNCISKMKKISIGIKSAITHTKLKLLGGDLCTYDGPLSYCVTVIGYQQKNKILTRKGAMPGDYLFITGTIGDAKLGLDCLKKKKTLSFGQKKIVKKFLFPPLRHDLSISLSPYTRSCIDLSDGFLLDAGKLARYSGCGLKIESSSIPLSKYAQKILSRNKSYSIEELLIAGDDYELAFAVEKKNFNKIKKEAKLKKIKLTQVGKFIKKAGTYLDNKKISRGYTHFNKI